MKVEVVYALPQEQVVVEVEVEVEAEGGAPVTIEGAIRASNVLRRFPEIDLAEVQVGVFGVVRPLDWELAEGERVEIYRPLLMTPVEARRRRAEARGKGK